MCEAGRRRTVEPWSLWEVEELERLLKSEHSDEEIAEKLGRSAKGVLAKKYALGFRSTKKPSRRWTEEEDRKLREAVQQGKDIAEIAAELRRTKKSIADRLRSEKASRRESQKWPPEKIEKLKELAATDMPASEIGFAIGKTADAVWQKMKVLGIQRPAKPRRTENRKSESERETLCWSCQRAHLLTCSWSRSFIPVIGWEATRTICEGNESYFVQKCPKYVKDQPQRTRFDLLLETLGKVVKNESNSARVSE